MPRHPVVRVTAVEDSEKGLQRQLELGRCDLGIISSPASSVLSTAHLTTVQVIALFPPNHPKSEQRGPVTIDELAHQPLLINGGTFPTSLLLMKHFNRAGIDPNVVYECSTGHTLAAMAEAGMGVAVFGDSVDLRGFRLRTRPVMDASGDALAFDLHVAWLRDAVPRWIQDFAIDLSTFHHTQLHSSQPMPT